VPRIVGFSVPRPRRSERLREVPVIEAPERPRAVFRRTAHPPEGRLLLETIRSHEPHCAPDDGHLHGGRRVVLVHPSDLESLGLVETDVVDLVIELGVEERRAAGFRVVSYPTMQGCAATYFPQPDVLVPEQDLVDPAAQVVIRLERSDA
jgi:hypothetical protein